MADTNALEVVYNVIIQASSPWNVFGDLSPDPAGELKKKYRHLSKIIHPDLFKTDPKASHMANEAMRELNHLHQVAGEQIANGIYGPAAIPSASTNRRTPTTSFSVDGFTYNLFGDALQGDFCQLFRADKIDSAGVSEPVILKIPLDAADNDLLVREAELLKTIHHKSLPAFLTTFIFHDGRLVNVLRPITGGFDLVSVRQHYPSGLPLEHVVWIMDRLLSVLGFLHINNAIHGSIEPGNIMIIPGNHNGLLLDFVFSIIDAHQPTACYLGANQYSAPEITRDRNLRPHPTTDMYSLGLSMLYLLGGDPDHLIYPRSLDPRFRKFLSEFLNSDPKGRASDAWSYHQKLKALRFEIFGAANQFLSLSLS